MSAKNDFMDQAREAHNVARLMHPAGQKCPVWDNLEPEMQAAWHEAVAHVLTPVLRTAETMTSKADGFRAKLKEAQRCNKALQDDNERLAKRCLQLEQRGLFEGRA